MANNLREQQKALLLSLRSKLVGQNHTLPYTIYKDEEIEALLAAQPHTIEELSKVKGFPDGGKRLKGFGEAIIQIFNNTNRIDTINLEFNGGVPEVVTTLKKMNLF